MSGATLTIDDDGRITGVQIIADTDVQQATAERTLHERGILNEAGAVLSERER